MQDLNDKINDGGATANGVLPAEQWNQSASEIQNLITSSGQALSGADLQQIAKAAAHYSANGDHYTVGGTANAITLSIVGSMLAPTAYTAGMRIRFKAASTNTGTVTINVNSIGVVSLISWNGDALNSNSIIAGKTYEATYNSVSGAFVLDGFGQFQRRVPLASGSFTSTSSLAFVLSTLDPVQWAGNVYEIEFSGYQPASNDKRLLVEFSSNAGSSYVATTYHYAISGIDTNASTNTYVGASTTIAGAAGESNANGGLSNTAGQTATTIIRLRSFNTGTSIRPMMRMETTYYEGGGTFCAQFGGASNSTADDYDAIRFKWESSVNFAAVGTYAIYKIA